jgi:hypothetical protein
MRTEMRSGMPRPARVEEDRPRQRNQVGIPVPTMASACSNSVMSPTAITGMRVAFFTARASGT